jgi:hypothetical protein
MTTGTNKRLIATTKLVEAIESIFSLAKEDRNSISILVELTRAWNQFSYQKEEVKLEDLPF